jgi:hypothetical protein
MFRLAKRWLWGCVQPPLRWNSISAALLPVPMGHWVNDVVLHRSNKSNAQPNKAAKNKRGIRHTHSAVIDSASRENAHGGI